MKLQKAGHVASNMNGRSARIVADRMQMGDEWMWSKKFVWWNGWELSKTD